MKSLPTILSKDVEVSTNHFHIEKLNLCFSNGVRRVYERMIGKNNGAVLIVPIYKNNLILVREYCAGTHSYELGFPKGKVDQGEDFLTAADRELQEEVGFKAKKYTYMRSVNSAPSFFQGSMALVLAEDLFESKLETGDEPEPLDIIEYPINKAKDLLFDSNFQEARCLVALSCFLKLKNLI